MRKTYSKPEIMFESFGATSNIASTCESIVGNPAKGTCAVLGTGSIAIFDSTVGNNACKFTPEGMGQDPDTWDGACYHNPTEYSNLFNS